MGNILTNSRTKIAIPEEISNNQQFLLQLTGPKGRAKLIQSLAERERKYTDAIAWVITDGLKNQVPDQFQSLELDRHTYIVTDQECDTSYYGLHEVEINPQRLVYPPKTLRCKFCDKDVDITDENIWQFPYDY